MNEAISTCPICDCCCGVKVEVDDDGRIGKVRGDKSFPPTAGFICPKGASLGALHNDPDRLSAPLLRSANGELEEVSWERALGVLHERLGGIVQASGPDSVAFHLGNPSAHDYGAWTYGFLALRLFGGRQVYTTTTVDHMPMVIVGAEMFGGRDTRTFTVPVPDLDRTDYLLILGSNPLVSNANGVTAPRGRLERIQERGGKIVVVDPARTRTAKMAAEHVAVRPGGDAALLAGMLQTIFAEGLDDVHELARGADELREAVAAFTPERVAGRSGIDADTIRRLAREYAGAERASFHCRVGAMLQEFGGITTWLLYSLAAVTGNLDREGGNMFPKGAAACHNSTGSHEHGYPVPRGRWKTKVAGHPEVLGELPAAALAEEILAPESEIRALVTIASNGARSISDSDSFERAARKVEFMVAIDPYLNESTRHADLILPPPPPLCKDHYAVLYELVGAQNHARWNDAVVPPPAGSPTEHELLLELVGALAGFSGAPREQVDDLLLRALVQELIDEPGSKIGHRDPEELLSALGDERGPERGLDLLLRVGPYGDRFGEVPGGLTLEELKRHPQGISFGELAPRLPEVLRTESGRVELAPTNLIADLPRLSAALDTESAPALVVIGRRQVRSNNSWLHNLPSLMKGDDRCTIQVHPADAERLGLTDGEQAKLASATGSVQAPVEVTEDMQPGVVCLPHGWGHHGEGLGVQIAEQHPGANLNAVTGPLGVDAATGNAIVNGVEVELAPVAVDRPPASAVAG